MNKRNFDLLLKEELKKIEGTTPSLLLHVCCGPCSSNVLKELCTHFNITIYYSNSNIYPDTEYYRRYNELCDFVERFNQDNQTTIQVIEDPYKPLEYLNHLMPLKDEKEGGLRCKLCYNLRMAKAYDYARKNNFDYWTTVLSVSPHKNSQWINEIGERKDQTKTKFLYADFKKNDGYKKSVAEAAKYNLYRQNYCGCLYSYEDMLEREKRKAQESTQEISL